MARWDVSPATGNDAAGDWFIDMPLQFYAKIHKALTAYVVGGENSPGVIDEARAAVYVVQQMGLPFVYNMNIRQCHIELAKAIINDQLSIPDVVLASKWGDVNEITESLLDQQKALNALDDSPYDANEDIVKDIERLAKQ